MTLFHLDTCGIDNVYLQNGYKELVSGGRECVVFEDLKGLYTAVGKAICRKPFLTGQDLRFLRGEMRMTQSRLGAVLGVSENMVCLWERRSHLPRLSLALIKALYLDSIKEPFKMGQLLMADEMYRPERFVFRFDGHWEEVK